MALTDLLGIGNVIKKSIQVAKNTTQKKSPLSGLIKTAHAAPNDAPKKSAAEALAELRAKKTTSNTTSKPTAAEALAQIRAKKTTSDPNGPKPLSEMLGINDPSELFKQLQNKSQAEGNFNYEDEKYDVMPLSDQIGEGVVEAGKTGLTTLGNVAIGGAKNLQDISQLKAPRIVGETADVVGKGANAVGDAVKNATLENMAKGTGELITGAVQQVPQIAGNIASTANTVLADPTVNMFLKNTPAGFVSDAAKGIKERKVNLSKGARDLGQTGKSGIKSLVKLTGLNPDSAASKVGEFGAEMAANAALTKSFGVGKDVFTPVKGLGSKLISNPEASGAVKSAVRGLLNAAGEKIPEFANFAKNSATVTGVSTGVGSGRLPTGGEVAVGLATDKVLNTLGKNLSKKAKDKYVYSTALEQATHENGDKFDDITERMMKKGYSASNADDFKNLMEAEAKDSRDKFNNYLVKNKPSTKGPDLSSFMKDELAAKDRYSNVKAKAIAKAFEQEFDGVTLTNLAEVDEKVKLANQMLKPYLSQTTSALDINSQIDKQMWELVRDWGKTQLRSNLPEEIYKQRYRAELAIRAKENVEDMSRMLNQSKAKLRQNYQSTEKQNLKFLSNIRKSQDALGSGSLGAVLQKGLADLLQNPRTGTLARKPVQSLVNLLSGNKQ